jgi:arylsulfatase A-like enzyme
MPPERPNVVVVHPHNLGRYLGCYGRPVETPNVDRLADEGRRFTDYYCTAPHCSPARGSMWTGRYPHENGLVGLSHLGWSLGDSEATLMDRLAAAGYETRLIGLQHVADDPADVGFQHADGSEHEFSVDEPAADVADRVEAFFAGGGGRGERPLFLSVGFSEVHRQPLVERCLDCGWTFDLPAYESDDPEAVDLERALPYLPDRPGVREDLAHFHGMVRAVDEAVGRVVEAVDDAGLREETLIVFTTDHGIGFPRAMGTCYDPGVEAALVARGPGVDPGVDDHLLSGVDFAPTVLDYAGVEVDGGGGEGDPIEDAPPMSGRSFAPLLTGEGGSSYAPRERVFLEFTWHSKYVPQRAVRTERYKYVRNFGDQPGIYIPAPLFTAPAGLAVREEFYGFQRPAAELYDLEADPHERENLIGDPAHRDARARLRERLDGWLERTDDRILEGPWPPTPEQEERVQKSPWVPREVGH